LLHHSPGRDFAGGRYYLNGSGPAARIRAKPRRAVLDGNRTRSDLLSIDTQTEINRSSFKNQVPVGIEGKHDSTQDVWLSDSSARRMHKQTQRRNLTGHHVKFVSATSLPTHDGDVPSGGRKSLRLQAHLLSEVNRLFYS
jgi:hypothetical protein